MSGVPVGQPDEAVGRWLVGYRRSFELSQTDVAMVMNGLGPFHWHASTVWKIENGRRSIYLSELVALARWAGMGVDSLLSQAGAW